MKLLRAAHLLVSDLAFVGIVLSCFTCALLVPVHASNQEDTSSAQEQQIKCFTFTEIAQAAADDGIDLAQFNFTEPICLPGPSSTSHLQAAPHNGIPDGVLCDAYNWCDSQGMCSTVCQRGSVKIDTWYQWAAAWQRNASRHKPLCHASLLGSHNSAITMADGYGNQDMYWQSFLEYLPNLGTTPILRTNNQWLSVTDQLNLGVRVVEVDTHWFEGALRAAHCGGLHSKPLNEFISVLNSLSKLMGNRIRWDTETIGCSPSLSSIPVRDQRLVASVLDEIAAWLSAPENSEEFLVVFFDDEKDIATWGKVPNLLQVIRDAFPSEWLFTPVVKASVSPDAWPSIAQMREHGARVVLVSRWGYGSEADKLMFSRKDVCGWYEPAMWELSSPPECISLFRNHSEPQDGGFSRINDCKLVYGPLNCNFLPRSTADARQQFSDASIQATSMCGWNCISPDWLTPSLARGTIWSWAPGEPRSLSLSTTPADPTTTAATSVEDPGIQSPARGAAAQAGAEEEFAAGGCVAMSALDGRWRTVSCDDALPIACKAVAGTSAGGGVGSWAAPIIPAARRPAPEAVWHLGCDAVFSAARGWKCAPAHAADIGTAQPVLSGSVRSVLAGEEERTEGASVAWRMAACAPGFEVAYPRIAWDNMALWRALADSGEARVMLPLRPGTDPGTVHVQG